MSASRWSIDVYTCGLTLGLWLSACATRGPTTGDPIANCIKREVRRTGLSVSDWTVVCPASTVTVERAPDADCQSWIGYAVGGCHRKNTHEPVSTTLWADGSARCFTIDSVAGICYE